MDTIYNYLLEKGFSKEAAAGIMGNIDVETGGTYDYLQKQDGGKGEGLFQFDFMKKVYPTCRGASWVHFCATKQNRHGHIFSMWVRNKNFY
mgnify:CR=1 FL=1